ncbi:MAG: glycosyltransferase family 39 protein [Candidatus Omnitrophica bacterium]|nr:glycosyltransferase family 39 protein [Candidatus Omnitrophota bacterium]
MISRRDRSFDVYSYCIIALFVIILILRWKWMPTFIDIYYHLLTVLNFYRCGGIPSISFWEYAPYGRPHLYPPLLHILMLIVFKLNGNILTTARIFELLIFPFMLCTIFLTIKTVFGCRLAFWSVLIASSMYSFYLSSVDFLPASLAFCLGLLVFYSLERNRIIAAIIFMALAFYSHVSISFFFFLALIIYGLTFRERLLNIVKITSASLFLYLPLLIHQLRYLSFFDPHKTRENFPFELNISVYLLAIIGIFLAIRQKKKFLFFIALVFAGIVFLPLRYRIFSGQGMIGIILLAALSLEFFYDKLINKFPKSSPVFRSLAYISLVFFAIFLISPTISIHESDVKFNLIGSTYINIIPSQEVRERTNEISIYLPKTFSPVIDVVEDQTNQDELIASNFEYLAGFISVFSQRATTSAMLPEIMPFRDINPFKHAKLIIWLKDPDRLTIEPERLIEGLDLVKVAETEIFFIYKNPQANFKQKDSQRSIAYGVCIVLLIASLAIAIFDLCRRTELKA